MSILGKLANGATRVVVGGGGLGIALAGEIIGGIGNAISPNNSFSKSVKNVGNSVGDFLFDNCGKVGNGLEKGVDTVYKTVGDIGGAAGYGVAKLAGASDETLVMAEKAGRIVGGAALGFVTGDFISDAMVSVAAGGLASTGTAISTLHGIAESNAILASIGGGSLAVGGGGMALGEAILGGTMAASTVAGAQASA